MDVGEGLDRQCVGLTTAMSAGVVNPVGGVVVVILSPWLEPSGENLVQIIWTGDGGTFVSLTFLKASFLEDHLQPIY